MEAKSLHPDTQTYISRLPGGQRAPAGERLPLADGDGLGPGGAGRRSAHRAADSHHQHRRKPGPARPDRWLAATVAGLGGRQAGAGETDILADAMPQFERIMLETALDHTHGHKQEAARLLGWGRNTLTRKLKELDIP